MRSGRFSGAGFGYSLFIDRDQSAVVCCAAVGCLILAAGGAGGVLQGGEDGGAFVGDSEG